MCDCFLLPEVRHFRYSIRDNLIIVNFLGSKMQANVILEN